MQLPEDDVKGANPMMNVTQILCVGVEPVLEDAIIIASFIGGTSSNFPAYLGKAYDPVPQKDAPSHTMHFAVLHARLRQ